MASQPTATSQRSSISLLVAIIGIILIFLAGGYVIYKKYVEQQDYHLLSFHLYVDGAVALGVVLLLVGGALYLRRR